MKGKRTIRISFATLAVLATALAVLIIGMHSVEVLSDTYNDNTTVLSKLNVTNVAPHITGMVVYKDGTAPASTIVLEEGTSIVVRCNGTVNDTNGVADISSVNATIHWESYSGSPDNNVLEENSSCLEVTQIDSLASYYTCTFDVWYYANNGTWTCNMTAKDTGGLKNSSTATREVDPLLALNLSNTEIDFGELDPNEISASDKVVNISNMGNRNISIAIRAYGVSVGDGWAMNCTVNNISLNYERYSTSSGQAWTSMTPVPGTFTAITGLTVLHRVDDGDSSYKNSTNSTYWKIKAPLGTRGVCNGTVEFSAVSG